MTKSELKEYLHEEVYGSRKRNYVSKLWTRFRDPSSDAVYCIRKFQYYSSKHKKILTCIFRNKLVKKYGIFIGRDTIIGRGLKLPHPNGIIFGRSVVIGENCRIFQQVTIGGKNNGDNIVGKQPQIKNNCTLFAGCKVIGDIVIEDGTVIGANAVLLSDTDENGIYAGVPAKKNSKH